LALSLIDDIALLAVPKAPPLHFHKNGNFKILQVADLHYSTDPGHCRDTDLSPCREGDYRTKELLARVLDEEKPDLVVFSGDQVSKTHCSMRIYLSGSSSMVKALLGTRALF
jgi:predicted MPP superfamily phosphohydrolase